jgi:predicted DNA-binding protein
MEELKNNKWKRLDFRVPIKYREKIDYICKRTYKTKTGFLKEMIDKNYEKLKNNEEVLTFN